MTLTEILLLIMTAESTIMCVLKYSQMKKEGKLPF